MVESTVRRPNPLPFPAGTVGMAALAYQDDYEYGDDGSPTPRVYPNSFAYRDMYDQMKASTVRTENRFADAYIEPEYAALDAFDDSDVTPVYHTSARVPGTSDGYPAEAVYGFADEFRGQRPGGPRRPTPFGQDEPAYETPLFWSVHVVAAYEGPLAKDYDPTYSDYLFGQSLLDDGPALIYLETIRDHRSTGFGLSEAALRARTTIHEVGHQLLEGNLIGDGDESPSHSPGDNIMNPDSSVPIPDDKWEFTPLQISIIRNLLERP